MYVCYDLLTNGPIVEGSVNPYAHVGKSPYLIMYDRQNRQSLEGGGGMGDAENKCGGDHPLLPYLGRRLYKASK